MWKCFIKVNKKIRKTKILTLMHVYYQCLNGLPQWLSSEEPICDAGDSGSIPGLGRPPGEGNGNSLHYSCLGNPTDRGPWQVTVYGAARIRHDLATKPKPPVPYKLK